LRDCFHEGLHVVGRPLERARWLFQGKLDPNDWRLVKDDAVGLRYMPLTTRGHARTGTRERVLETARRHPDRLRIELNALATRVILDGQQRALGVEYLSGERLYRADPRASRAPGQRREVRASREVILAGGAFNTPQLLMLSGIGPRDTLARHGIDARVDLPGVGKNLQDRYETSVIHRMSFDNWACLEGARFCDGDLHHDEWSKSRRGVYATNGGMFGMITRSAPDRALPDLFVLVLLGHFQGYFPTYSAEIPKNLNCLTWTILKAHTNNRAGEVTLASADPRDTPRVNFRYFGEGGDAGGEDLDSVVEGVKLVRAMASSLQAKGLIAAEELPGAHRRAADDLRQFVRDNAWGHHASCTCHIAPRSEGGVLGPDFRVHGTRGLRVVDASVFPRIPGFFIASAVYMIGEKAADAILSDAARGAAV
ncbi:MAG: GMC family oxidoreductase, partial [Candidatus Rokuibacteriota bacterium]